MNDTPEMPTEGGSYTRTKSGALKRIEEPTAQVPNPAPVGETPSDPGAAGTSGKEA